MPPKKRYYLGRLKYGAPYFYPINFVSSIIGIRKLIINTGRINRISFKYLNLPIVRRSHYKIIRVLGNDYYVTWGWPMAIKLSDLRWKDKYNIPRFERCPQFAIFFFKWQFVIQWQAPDGKNDLYYEMMLHYLYYANKDLTKAKETWKWVNYNTRKSTWNNKYLK